MTTLQLAEKIAAAVLSRKHATPAHAVIATLHKYDSWFCRVRFDERGEDVGEVPYEQERLPWGA